MGKGLRNVDFLHILALVREDLLPLLDERALGGVLGNGTDLILYANVLAAIDAWRIQGMTHACRLDGICQLDKQLLVLGYLLASDEDFKGEPAAFELFEMFRCGCISQGSSYARAFDKIASSPFFAVVRM